MKIGGNVKIELNTVNWYIRWLFLRIMRVVEDNGETSSISLVVTHPRAYFFVPKKWEFEIFKITLDLSDEPLIQAHKFSNIYIQDGFVVHMELFEHHGVSHWYATGYIAGVKGYTSHSITSGTDAIQGIVDQCEYFQYALDEHVNSMKMDAGA